jgi:hypothetical protein
MNVRALITALFLSSLSASFAEEQPAGFDAFAPVKASTTWKSNPALWRELLNAKPDTSAIMIGKSDVLLGGALAQTLRRPRGWSDLNLGQKVLALPIINLFVPQPMPATASGGKYFAWGESRRSWGALAAGVPAGNTTPLNQEPTAALISFRW